MMAREQSRISVWLCREEKIILGVSKRTSCADVVRALVQGERSAPQSYCIVEKWRGCERILPSRTKILRLWVAWGEEQRSVKFVLVRSEASLASRGARSAEARVVLSRGPAEREVPRCPMAGISTEKQRRVVRKAFRKLEKMKKAAREEQPAAERVETLVHLVVSQDHTIRQQLQRISELDAEIEKCEAQVHVDRMRRHGLNYVQDTYLLDAAAATASSREEAEQVSSETLDKFEEFVLKCEELVRLQEQLWEQEALAEAMTGQVQEELNHRWMQRRQEELQRRDTPELLLEAERIHTQLDASAYIGLRLHTDLEAIRSDLELSQEICEAREKEMRDLVEKVNTLDIDEGRRGGPDDQEGMMSTEGGKSEWVEQARGLSQSHTIRDDDSDTGLSSLHSQDSDCQPGWESLV
ncbi:ras association domain-containing protein 10 [Synchiropus splendidus]|uniref:ras association domain-containing protein 10 n=1 Tax=Synchiropus splendidus TaxID=270530 RepID=UPI00237DB034|nr:ras association domain-containing protein 10 [Synchiropus splendidus]